MRAGSLLRVLLRRFRISRSSRRRARSRGATASLLGLELRLLTSGIDRAPDVVMLSATTRDSRSVTVDYRIDPPAQALDSLQFTVYRSGDARLDADDREVERWSFQVGTTNPIADVLDDWGTPAVAAGEHRLTIPLSAGLTLDVQEPYVLVVADAGVPRLAPDPSSTASFRKYTIGVVTHGAMINPSWKHGPPWQLQTAAILRQQGFDAVIPFNWAGQSSKPGRAPAQGARLTRQGGGGPRRPRRWTSSSSGTARGPW
ncbi:MAG: hypothetical protein U0790_17370 [Isosphaeraceae bacterium]